MMFRIFYDFCGLNQQLFKLANQFFNLSILPEICHIISGFFAIDRVAIYYAAYSIYHYWHLRRMTVAAKQLAAFWSIYQQLVRFGLAYAVFGLAYAGLKFTVNLPRPFCSLPPGDFITIVAEQDLPRCLSSFPSSHVGLAVLLGYFCWPHCAARVRIIIIIIILLIAISRLSLAMHYPADIIYSCLITGLVINISQQIYPVFANNLIKQAGNLLLKLL